MPSLHRAVRLSILGLLAVLAACVHVNKSVLTPGLAPVAFGDVHVYFAGDSLPQHTRVAILNASGSSGFTNEAQMIDKLREEAGKLGANAIVLEGLREPGGAEKIANALVGGFADANRRGQAIAIWVPSLAGGAERPPSGPRYRSAP